MARVPLTRNSVGQFVRTAQLAAGSNVTITESVSGSVLTVTVSASGGGGGGTPATSVVSETSYGQSPVVGTSTDYARGDHSHGTPPAIPAASTVVSETSYGQASQVGTSSSFARADHSHGTPAIPAHSALSSLGWGASGHTGGNTAVATWDGSGVAASVAATSDETMLARRGGILQWVAIPIVAVALSPDTIEIVELVETYTDTTIPYSFPGTIT